MAITYPYSARQGEPVEGIDGLEYAHTIGQFPGSPIAPNRNLGIWFTLVNADITLGDDAHVIFADASAGPITITLPSMVGVKYRQRMHIRVLKFDSSGNAVTVHAFGSGADTINGGASVSIATQYKGYDIYVPTDDSSTAAGTGNGLWFAVACG